MRDSRDGSVGEVTVSHRDITVTQAWEQNRFGVPTVTLTFVSNRDTPARVEVMVELPDELDIDKVGFHPEYRGADWEVVDRELTFGTEIGPGEEITTMYAVESSQPEQLDTLLKSISFEQVREIPTAESTADQDGPRTVSPSPDTPTGQGDSVIRETVTDWETGAERAEQETEPEETEPEPEKKEPEPEPEPEKKEPEPEETEPEPEKTERETGARDARTGGQSQPAGGPAEPSEPDTSGEASGGSRSLAEYSTSSLIAELGRRNADNSLTEEERNQLRVLLAGRDDNIESQIASLQERLTTVEALLEPTDQPATPSDGVESDLESLSGDFETISDEVATTRERVESVATRLDDVEDQLTGLRTDLDDGADRVTTRLDALELAVADLREEVGEGFEEQRAGFKTWHL